MFALYFICMFNYFNIFMVSTLFAKVWMTVLVCIADFNAVSYIIVSTYFDLSLKQEGADYDALVK